MVSPSLDVGGAAVGTSRPTRLNKPRLHQLEEDVHELKEANTTLNQKLDRILDAHLHKEGNSPA